MWKGAGGVLEVDDVLLWVVVLVEVALEVAATAAAAAATPAGTSPAVPVEVVDYWWGRH